MAVKKWDGPEPVLWTNIENWGEAGKGTQAPKPCLSGRVEHCYHKTGLVMTSDPCQYGKKCCWCGDEIVAMDPAIVPDPGHGPFAVGPLEDGK